MILKEATATIMVYGFTSDIRPGVICPRIARFNEHPVTLRFNQPGEAMIRIWVRRDGNGAAPGGVPVVLEHRVTVR